MLGDQVTQETCNVLGCIPEMEKPNAMKSPQKGEQFFDNSGFGQSVSHPVRNLRGDEHHVTFSQKFQDIKGTLTTRKH